MDKVSSKWAIEDGGSRRTQLPRVKVALGMLSVLVALASLLAVMQGASASNLGGTAAQTLQPLAANSDSGAVPAECGQAWRVISSPDGSTAFNNLWDVVVIADNDVWAVGDSGVIANNAYQPLAMAEHWNGSAWSLVTVPQPGTSSTLKAVSAVTSRNIWAVGSFTVSTIDRTLILHYDGISWTQVPSPNLGSTSNGLFDVVSVSPSAAWAVGAQVSQTTVATSVLFWDGSNWANVPSPHPYDYDSLYGVTATSADDMWAVGYGGYSNPNQPGRALSLHCTRTQCTSVATPNSGVGNNLLTRVAALSPSDVWAVGYSQTMTQPSTLAPIMLHWNGEGWSALPAPPLPSGTNYDVFNDVIPISSNAVWAVGETDNTSIEQGQTYAVLWNGSSWSVSSSLNLNPYNAFFGGDALSVNDLWVVGTTEATNPSIGHTLVERYNDPCVTPTPTQTSIPIPTSTPPACSIEFTDVPAGSTFYPYVHCLACRNMLGGYTAGCSTGNPCFKPGNRITRGQLAKVVSNAAGYNDTHSTQTFQDVPVGSTFYAFVERLASRNIIGGYACGGTGEPCVPPANLPYFRPNAQVTRGQTSKIVAIAASLPAPPSGQQTFQDVPTNSTFWQWIESLATAGTIGGYQCGGAGEPCVPPHNRPYFRPNNDVTRGQAAKIVSNTFFPNCQSH